jgi:hypothetical protein
MIKNISFIVALGFFKKIGSASNLVYEEINSKFMINLEIYLNSPKLTFFKIPIAIGILIPNPDYFKIRKMI